MGQMGFFDIAKRYAGLDAKNDPLVKIDAVVPWETLRPRLEAAWRKPAGERKSLGGLAEAIRDALARWPALCRFLDDGRVRRCRSASSPLPWRSRPPTPPATRAAASSLSDSLRPADGLPAPSSSRWWA